jgi:hypothetical protein
LLLNTFCLCAELQAPLQFAAILQEIWRDNLVQGEWDGFDLQEELARALLMNQSGPNLRSDWFALLEGGRPSRLVNEPEDAVIGVAWMPESEKSIGRPWSSEIARALGLAASRLEELDQEPAQRRSRFDSLLASVREPYLDWRDSDWDLAAGAMEYGWAPWASLRLRLFMSRDEHNGHKRVLVSKYLADLLTDRHAATDLTHPCSKGIVRELDVCAEGYRFLETVAQPFEILRRKNPFDGDGSMAATLLAVLQNIDKSNRQTGQTNQDAATDRGRLYAQLCVAAIQAYPESESELREDLQRVADGRVDPNLAGSSTGNNADMNPTALANDALLALREMAA